MREVARRIALFAAALAAAGGFFWAAAPARAQAAEAGDPSESVAKRLTRLERLVGELSRQMIQLSASYVSVSLAPPTHELSSRLSDGQVAYYLRDYTQASIIYLDVVEEPRFKGQPAYEEALYFLADSLYQNRNFLGARRYFGELMSSYPRSKFYQDALTKVVSMALVTGRHDEVDTFYARLTQTSGAAIAPELPYLYAKSLYQRGEHARAIQALGGIPQASPYFVRARFFLGGVLATQKRYPEAVRAFLDIYKLDPLNVRGKDDAETAKLQKQNRELVEMTHLALGRLHHDLGDLIRAADAYQEVNRKADQFPEALFELAWTWIKGKQYEKARRALELLMLSRVDSQTLPEAQVLLGDLQLLLGRPEDAAKTYQSVKATFEPIRKELAEHIKNHPDPVRYFNSLLAGKLDRMDPSAMLPPVATRWVRSGERVRTAMQVVRDLNASRDQLMEAKKIVTRLEAALAAKDKLEMFPLLKDARITALELEHKFLRAKLEITFLEWLIISEQVAPPERELVLRKRAERKRIEVEFDQVPPTKEEYLKRRDEQKRRVAELESEVHKVAVQVDGIQAQLVAAVRYWHDSKKGRTVTAEEERGVFAKIEAEKASVKELQLGLERLRSHLVAERAKVGVGDEAIEQDDVVRKRFSEALDEERKAMAPLRLRVVGDRFRLVKSMEGMRERIEQNLVTLRSFRTRLGTLVVAKAEEYRQRIEREKRLLMLYDMEVAGQEKETEQLAGGVAYETYRKVQRKFYDLVIGADRGLVEIVWREKDSRARRVQQLKANRKVESRILDEEFKDVLRED
jgi:tetratricopeptide (TPR) repeat protein